VNIKERAATSTLNLISFKSSPLSGINQEVTVSAGAQMASLDFTANGNYTPIALDQYNTGLTKIESIVLIDITYEPTTSIYKRPAEKLTYNFKSGATRVRIPTTSYQIDDVYESGYLLFRVRRVRPDSVQFKFEKFSPWSDYALTTNTVNSYPNKITVGAHTGDTLNWNYCKLLRWLIKTTSTGCS
jgi:hypothetical protein